MYIYIYRERERWVNYLLRLYDKYMNMILRSTSNLTKF